MYISIRFRKGRVIHCITEGSDSPRETLCGLESDGAIVSDADVTCRKCLHVRAKRIAASR